jgi:hypothetical protein
MPPNNNIEYYSQFPKAILFYKACYVRVTHPCATKAYCYTSVRLACIKPAASVHPEPGSNSPLYYLYMKPQLRNKIISNCLIWLTLQKELILQFNPTLRSFFFLSNIHLYIVYQNSVSLCQWTISLNSKIPKSYFLHFRPSLSSFYLLTSLPK